MKFLLWSPILCSVLSPEDTWAVTDTSVPPLPPMEWKDRRADMGEVLELE